jgi:hypothetical protein
MNITLQPVISVSPGSKLVVTLWGQAIFSSTPAASPAVTMIRLIPPILPSQNITDVISYLVADTEHTINFLFGAPIPANTLIILTFGTFELTSTALKPMDSVDAAIVDSSGIVISASSTGTFPAVFANASTGSSVRISSSISNASATMFVYFSIFSAISELKLSGLTFTEFAKNNGNRRLMQTTGTFCTNLQYAGELQPFYDTSEGEFSLKFPPGGASKINQEAPSNCSISGFRNSQAATRKPVVLTTYDASTGAGLTFDGTVLFPPILCQPGYRQIISGETVLCKECQMGEFNDIPGNETCEKCPLGRYNNALAATSLAFCTECPATTFSNFSGATKLDDCKACLPGTNSSKKGAKACDPCRAGSYSKRSGQESCDACPAGSFAKESQSIECKPCPPGTSTFQNGTTECNPCRAGSFSESPGQQFCDLCPAGTFGEQERSSTKTICQNCPSGYFSEAGSMICMRCPPGTSSDEGNAQCYPCPKGKFSITGDCIDCPGITYSLEEGSDSNADCSGILVTIGGSRDNAYFIGGLILIIYILSFSLVPSWSAVDPVMRLELTANFEGRVEKSAKLPKKRRPTTWRERVSMKFSTASALNYTSTEKRFFEVGDSLIWQSHDGTTCAEIEVGTIESTSVYPEQDADELGDFVAFVKMNAEYEKFLQQLSDAVGRTDGEKTVLMDSKCRSCRCLLKKPPSRHAKMPFCGLIIGRWEIVRQISACFQLLLLSLFPAIDTISDLVYILSTEFANYYIFAASLVCLTSQFWLYIMRLKQRRVLQSLTKRRIDLVYLKGLWWWPKWASPDSLPVFLTMIVPIYVLYHVVFPVLWFFLGYLIYSFQLFPISRISNRWLYAFV